MSGWYLLAALATCGALLLWPLLRRRKRDEFQGEPGPTCGSDCKSPTCVSYVEPEPEPVVDPVVQFERETFGNLDTGELKFEKNLDTYEGGPVADEPILSDVPTSDLSGLAAYDQMKNEEKPKTRVLIIDDGQSGINAMLARIADQGPFITIDSGDDIAKALMPIDPKEIVTVDASDEELQLNPVGSNDALRQLRQGIMQRVRKNAGHWIWKGKTFTFRKQNVRHVLWNWLSRVPDASSIKLGPGPDGTGEPDILLDNERLKNECGISKCIRPDHQTKVVRRSIASYKPK